MAWVHPEPRQCPSCGYTARVLITQDGDRYRLSCGWCATLSEPMGVVDAFFHAWDGARLGGGPFLECAGVPHWWRGKFIESVPIRVTLVDGVAYLNDVF